MELSPIILAKYETVTFSWPYIFPPLHCIQSVPPMTDYFYYHNLSSSTFDRSHTIVCCQQCTQLTTLVTQFRRNNRRVIRNWVIKVRTFVQHKYIHTTNSFVRCIQKAGNTKKLTRPVTGLSSYPLVYQLVRKTGVFTDWLRRCGLTCTHDCTHHPFLYVTSSWFSTTSSWGGGGDVGAGCCHDSLPISFFTDTTCNHGDFSENLRRYMSNSCSRACHLPALSELVTGHKS